MKKTELLAGLKKKFFKVGKVALADPSKAGQSVRVQEGVAWYIVGI